MGMIPNKKRILLVGESHFLSTGYGVYSKNLLSYLHNTGKYEINELGCYCGPNDPRQQGIPWKFYPNGPDENNPKEVQAYNSNTINQFGEWKFEAVALDCMPDIVTEFRDHWYFAYQETSPFRRMYNWCICPTVDSINQNEEWLSTYTNADGVFTYTDWSKNVLEKEGGGLINTLGSTPVCVELDIFKPVQNKSQQKTMFGLREDAFIVGTVMRNQKRKLYPDLLEAFSQFLGQVDPKLAERSLLYIHASYPDLGWDFPRLIKNLGLSNKVLFTYLCHKCGLVFPRFYSDVRTACPKCNNVSATFPNTQQGIDRNSLSHIYNLFDVYVQYSNSEGQGVPQIEAASCGVPVMSVDYSGMADVVRKVKGYPIAVKTWYHESETGCVRAMPDNEDFVQKLIKFATMPEMLRSKKGNETRKAAEQHYNWLSTCKKWEAYIDSVPARPLEETWLSAPHIVSPANLNNFSEADRQYLAQMTDDQFVNWALVNVACKPEWVNSYFAMKVARDLAWGVTIEQPNGILFNDLSLLGLKPSYVPYDRNKVINQFMEISHKHNFWESQRGQKIQSLAGRKV